MITAIFDTNIYGRFIEEKQEGLALANKVKQEPNFLIHNFKLIRNELRRAPIILPVCDELVANRVVEETKQIKENDFKIVACDTIFNCDLVVTEDQRTLLNPIAVKAYSHVNLKNNKRMPTLYRYNDLKRKYF